LLKHRDLGKLNGEKNAMFEIAERHFAVAVKPQRSLLS
jgi:hypothetical protein